MLDLEPIKKRLSLTTPGPWKAVPVGSNCKNPRTQKFSKAEDDCILTDDNIEILGCSEWIRVEWNDLDFMASAKTDIELLIQEIEYLRNQKGENKNG